LRSRSGNVIRFSPSGAFLMSTASCGLIQAVGQASSALRRMGNALVWRRVFVRRAAEICSVGGSSWSRTPRSNGQLGLLQAAWDEQVAPRCRAGEPAPALSRERFLRLLDAAEYLAAHIHEAPVWIVPCLKGGTPTRTSGSSIYPAVQNMPLAARALGLGATLTTLHLQFEKEAEAALGLPPNVHSMPCSRSATRWDGSGRCAVSLSQMSSMKIGGIRLTGICSGLTALFHDRKLATSDACRKAAIYRMNPSM